MLYGEKSKLASASLQGGNMGEWSEWIAKRCLHPYMRGSRMGTFLLGTFLLGTFLLGWDDSWHVCCWMRGVLPWREEEIQGEAGETNTTRQSESLKETRCMETTAKLAEKAYAFMSICPRRIFMAGLQAVWRGLPLRVHSRRVWKQEELRLIPVFILH